MNETWRTTKTNPNYEVSNLGNVRSKDRWVDNPGNPNGGYSQKGKPLRVCKAQNGYFVVNLGKNKTQYIHRLVCEAFIGQIPKGMTVNHKNGDKGDNRAENLEIMTYSENHLHAFRELHRKPTCLGKTNANVSKPISQFKDGKLIATYPSAREATRQTGVCFKGISACCHGKAKTAGGYQWAISGQAEG